MDREDIIRMVATYRPREAGISESHAFGMFDFLEHFAALVAAAEREACAKVCEDMDHNGVMIAADCAAAIRARGDNE